jgi:hypothetical protein
VIGTAPSSAVRSDDPGHTYHLLSDGSAVSTSDPQKLPGDIAQDLKKQVDPKPSENTTPPPTPKSQFATWSECLRHLAAEAAEAYQQISALSGAAQAEKIGSSASLDRTTGQYDLTRANSILSSKRLNPQDFALKISEKGVKDATDLDEALGKLKNCCDETDGTNRSTGSGDGTSEWALGWEAEHGEPMFSANGHADKIVGYCESIKRHMSTVEAKRGATTDATKIATITALLARAQQRLASMQAGLRTWNTRMSNHPSVWNPDGTTRVAPPGTPAGGSRLVAGWPRSATVTIP